MKTTEFEKLDGNVIKFDIEIDAKEAQEAYNKVLADIKKTINIPGFRKGKVPNNVVEQRVGADSIKHQAIEKIFPKEFQNVVIEKDLKIAQQPYVEDYTFELGKPLVLTVKVELKPEVELGQYKDTEIEYEEFKNADNAIEKELKDLQERMVTFNKVEGRSTKDNDIIVFDFKGYNGDKEIEGGSAKNYTMDLAHSNFIPGFAEQLVDRNIEEDFTIDVKFPEEYHNEELKGAPAKFDIKIHEIKEKVYPELNDDFANKVTQGKMKTLEDLKADIQKFLDENEKTTNQRNKENAAFDKIVAEAKIDIQPAMIEREKEAINNETEQRAKAQGLDYHKMVEEEGFEKVDKEIEQEAIRRIKNSLVIEKISAVEKIKIEQNDVFDHINLIANQYGDKKVEAMQEIFQNPNALAMITQQIATEKVAKMLVENNKFTPKKGDK